MIHWYEVPVVVALALGIAAGAGVPDPAEAVVRQPAARAASEATIGRPHSTAEFPAHADAPHVQVPTVPLPRTRSFGSSRPGFARPGATIPGSPGMLIVEDAPE
jgi:hypothetical protein